MIYIISGICAAIAYSSDSIFGKIALKGLPLNIYFIIVAFIYSLVGIVLAIIHRNDIYKYIKKENFYYFKYAIVAAIIGTILGDYLMFYTINKSSEVNLPIAITLIHLAPIFSLFLVYFWFKKTLNIRAIFGIILVFIGTLIALYNSDDL
jgi:drug/metabolite transporter (DMT)-like permease